MEECRFEEQLILEIVALRAVDLFVRRDAATTVYRSAAVSQLNFAVGGVGGMRQRDLVVVVKRDAW